MIWLIWDRRVDETFRPDFHSVVGQAIPRNPIQTMNKEYCHRVDGMTRDQIEKLGALYNDYLTFKVSL